MTDLLLIRHGQIDANVSQHWHGSTDSPLNAIGHGQVTRLRAHLRTSHPDIAAVYTSPLQRTHHTARGAVADLGLEVRPHNGLREWGIGELEGLHYRELINDHRLMERSIGDRTWTPPGGESMHGVIERMVDALEAIARSHPGEKVAVVSHGMAISLALARLIDDDHTGFGRFVIGDCSLTHLRRQAEHLPAAAERPWTLLACGDTTHLDD